MLERVAADPDGPARLRAARAHARAWAAGAHPDLELLVVDMDATLVMARQRCPSRAPALITLVDLAVVQLSTSARNQPVQILSDNPAASTQPA